MKHKAKHITIFIISIALFIAILNLSINDTAATYGNTVAYFLFVPFNMGLLLSAVLSIYKLLYSNEDS